MTSRARNTQGAEVFGTYPGAMSQLERITTDPAVCHGKATIRGLRFPVENLLELLAAGMSADEILVDYPYLERDDVVAVLEFVTR